MVLKGRCRIIIQDGELPKKVLIYIPLDIAKDSQFPFKKSENASIEVSPQEGRIIIEKDIREDS